MKWYTFVHYFYICLYSNCFQKCFEVLKSLDETAETKHLRLLIFLKLSEVFHIAGNRINHDHYMEKAENTIGELYDEDLPIMVS